MVANDKNEEESMITGRLNKIIVLLCIITNRANVGDITAAVIKVITELVTKAV